MLIGDFRSFMRRVFSEEARERGWKGETRADVGRSLSGWVT